MHYRSIAILTVCCLAFWVAGCESLRNSSKPKRDKKSKGEYQEVLMPQQTGSVLQRRAYVLRGPDKKKSTSAKKPSPTPKPTATPEPEVSPTPKPEEESSPTPTERFR